MRDGRTDVARGGDDRWEVSYGGRTGWRKLNSGSLVPLGRTLDLIGLTLVGDFTGDHRADVLQYATFKGGPPTGPRSLTRYKVSSGGDRRLAVWSEHDMP